MADRETQQAIAGVIVFGAIIGFAALLLGLDNRQMRDLEPYLKLVCALALPISWAIMALCMRHYLREAGTRWKTVAEALGLELVPGENLQLRGSVDGVPVDVRQEVRRRGKKRREWLTVARAELDEGRVPSGLRIGPERAWDALAKAVGGEDIQVGVPDLDRLLRFRGRSHGEVRAFARHPEVAAALRRLSEHERFSVEGRAASITLPGLVTDAAQLRRVLDDLVALALAARGEGSNPSRGGRAAPR